MLFKNDFRPLVRYLIASLFFFFPFLSPAIAANYLPDYSKQQILVAESGYFKNIGTLGGRGVSKSFNPFSKCGYMPCTGSSSNNTLANLTISQGTLSPAFSPDTYFYTDNVSNSINSIVLTALSADSSSTITINGLPVINGTPSGTIILNYGQNVVTIVVTAQDSDSAQTYTLTITRALPANSDLSGLTISLATLSPSFASDSTNYTDVINIVKKSHTVYTMGDSITGLDEYPPALSALLNYIFTFVNFGIKGDVTANMVNRFQPVINAGPDDVIILGGNNDIGVFNKTALQVENNLQAMYTMAHNAGIKVIALTITPFKGHNNWTSYKQTVVDSVNAWIPKATNVDYVIDTYTGLVDPANPYQLLPAYDDGDHLHPSVAGMNEIAALIYAGAKFIPNPLVDQYNIAHSTVAVTPVLSDPRATVTVNDQAIASGATSANIPLSVGSNKIITKVTAQNGTTIKTYTVNVTALPSTNANLANFYVTKGDLYLAPLFSPGIANYTTTVNYDTTHIYVRAYVLDATATLTIDGKPATSGVLSAPINLVPGLNTIRMVVTAQDGITIKIYTLTINRLITSNDDLADIKLNNGLVLSPAFTADQLDYSVKIPSSISSVLLTPFTSAPSATVTINSQNALSAVPFTIPLTAASATENISVTAADQAVKRTYKVLMVWAITDASLSGLKISGTSISPVFNKTVVNYTASTSGTSVTITPTADDLTSTINVNGTVVTTGSASAPIALVPGANTITIAVTAKDGITTRTYTVNITRAPSSNDNLSSIILSPTAALSVVTGPDYKDYAALVSNAISAIRIIPTAAVNTSTITVNGIAIISGSATAAIPLNIGPNIVTTTVTAEDGVSTHTYVMVITRTKSTDAALSALKLSSGIINPGFKAGVVSYNASVANTVTSIAVTATTNNANAIATVNGITITSGTATGAIGLNVGLNIITLVVTAQDGVTIRTYTVTATRAPSNNDDLSSFKLNPTAALTLVSGPDYKDYTASVSNGVSSIQLIPTTAVATSSVTVNGVVVASGVSSDPIALKVGANTITTVVTAQDGVSTHTYVVNVTRAAVPLNSVFETVSVSNPTDHPQLMGEEINVHQSLSPNGDGINDFLIIDGIAKYPNNKLTIMNRSGLAVFEAKGYDNSNKVFDGHSNKNGAMQLPGTYFYSLDYAANGTIKHKTGFIVLKY